MPTAWRIVKKKYAGTAFDGEGARLNGGRWNAPGVAMVYGATTRALAVLEMAVHLNHSTHLASFVLIPAEFDESLMTRVDMSLLPRDWRREPPSAAVMAIGGSWVKDARSAVLAVPSAIIEREDNYLLNPKHPDFSRIAIGAAESFTFDTRLITLAHSSERRKAR